MFDDRMEINLIRLKRYTDFLETQCQQIKTLCEIMEADLSLVTPAMDELNGQITAKNLRKNIENIRSTMPVSTEVYDRLVLIRKKLIELVYSQEGNQR